MFHDNDPQMHRLGAPRHVLVTIFIVLVVVATVLSAAILTYLDQPATPTAVAGHTPTGAPAASPTSTSSQPPTPSSPTATPTPLPTATPTEPCIPPANWVPYTVQERDTLESLALRHGIPAYLLMQNNCLTSPTLLPGQTIWVPPPNVTPTNTVVPTPCGPPPGWRQYTVERGDTLYSLSRRHRTTVVAIKKANCLTSNLIVAGQKLWLPPLPPTWTPTITPTPTDTGTPTPTATMTETLTPTPSPTLTKSPTPTPTSTSETSPLPEPATPTEAPPTVTPTPTDTPITTPTDTPTPTSTSETSPLSLPAATPTVTP